MVFEQEKNHISKNLQRQELICDYNSSKFKPNEIKYIIFEKELLAIKLAIKKFHIFLAPEDFIIWTDNQAVKDFLINKRNINPLNTINGGVQSNIVNGIF